MSIRKAALELAYEDPSFRRLLVASLLKESMEHSSEDSRRRYLKEHPNADPTDHVVNDKGKGNRGHFPTKGKFQKTKKIEIEDRPLKPGEKSFNVDVEGDGQRGEVETPMKKMWDRGSTTSGGHRTEWHPRDTTFSKVKPRRRKAKSW